MSLHLNTHNKVSHPPAMNDSVYVFRKSVIGPVEYDSGFCISYIQDGKIEKRINNRKILLSSGDLIMVSPGSKVFSSSYGEVNGVSAFFSNFSSVLPGIHLDNDKRKSAFVKALFSTHKHSNYSTLKTYFDRLIEEPTAEAKNDVFMIISDIIKNNLKYYYERLSLISSKRVSTQLDILQRMEHVKSTIDGNCVGKFNLDEIAKENFMSKFALVRNFKEAFQTTPQRYYVARKISLAKDLLQSGMSVKETAAQCGYSDIFSFSKQFKMTEGYSPSEIKRSQKA